MKFKIKLFLILSLFSINLVASAEKFDLDPDMLAFINSLLAENSEQQALQKENTPVNPIDNKIKEKVKQKSTESFNDFVKHFEKFYPNAFLIREHFLTNMTPEDIAKTLTKIINTIAYEPWIYVESIFKTIVKRLSADEKAKWKKQGYDVELLQEKFSQIDIKKTLIEENGMQEFITTQIDILDEFIKDSKVNLETKIVFFEKTRNYSSLFTKQQNNSTGKNETLVEYWDKNNIKIHHDFYELYFDYYCRLFIESIIQEDRQSATKYNTKLKDILKNLTRTPAEAAANLYITKYESLLQLLKQQYYNQKFSFIKENSELSELLNYWDSHD